MKKILAQKRSVVISLLCLSFFGTLSYVLFGGRYQLVSASVWLVLADVLILFFSFLWLTTIREKIVFWLLHLTIPLTLNISTALFIFFCSVMWIGVLVAFVSSLLIFLSLSSVESGRERRYLVNASSFIVVVLSFFSLYSLIAFYPGLYWVGGVLAVTVASWLLHYLLASAFQAKEIRIFLVFLFALLLFEFFIISLSWPVQSVFLKSLLMAAFYYFYWGTSERFLVGADIKREIAGYLVVLFLIVVLVILSLFIRGGIGLL